MANAPRQKGTRYENRVLARLRKVWPAIDRAKAGSESNDFTGPFPIEAKHRKVWDLKTWCHKVRQRALADGTGNRWAIMAGGGDLRTDPRGEVMIVDADFGIELIAAWVNQNAHTNWRQTLTRGDR